MCNGHSDVGVEIGGKAVGVDGCIASLVAVLNGAGYRTLASCCGHHDQAATIPLLDLDGVERWLILTRDRAEGERMMWGTVAAAEARGRKQAAEAIATSDAVLNAAAAELANWNRQAVAGFRQEEVRGIAALVMDAAARAYAAEQDTAP